MTIPVYYSAPGVGRFRFYWNNLADATATVETSSSAAAEYPLANIKNIWPTYVFRTASLGAPDYIKWDLHTAQFVSCFILWNHNISAGATIRLQGNATDSWGTPTYDEAVTWTEENLVHVLTSAVSLRWWRLIITDALNPDGYISAGCRFLGDVFQPGESNATRVPSLIDPSEIAFSRGGQLTAAQLDGYDQMSYAFDAVGAADQATMKTIYRALGTFKPYFIIEDSNYPTTTVYYVRNISAWKFGQLAYPYKTFQLDVETMR
ncbi:MAG: hypothetical protein PHC52_11890 [Syntrophales bacterium]|nr:hypothetical protein [Syntrophales bacterium]